MSFVDVLSTLSDEDIAQTLANVSDEQVVSSLSKSSMDIHDALVLLSPKATSHVETMAQLAHERTVQQFGYTMQLFITVITVVSIVDIVIIVRLFEKN